MLFRSRRAPTRYEENDIYWADRHISPDQKLPESGLLKALHAYASDFYEKTTSIQAGSSYESMDGSALIALGVLLEELCKEKLGETGDLAFVEGELSDTEDPIKGSVISEDLNEARAPRTEAAGQSSQTGEIDHRQTLADDTNGRKRIKIRHNPGF